MAIEVTDEMVQLVYEQIDFVNHGDDGIREGLVAVLAIVERDRAAEAEAVADVIRAYRASRAKGYFRSPRGPVAWAVDVLDRAVGTP